MSVSSSRGVALILSLCGLLLWSPAVHAQKTVNLTLDSAVDLAISNSYRVRQLQLSVEQSRSWLEADRAQLRSSAQLRLSAPEIQSVSDRKWNSDAERYQIVRENTRQWDMNLSVRQPVILFGYPTNGYLSFHNTMYRLRQLSEGSSDVQYYNRYFVEFSQPLFQPNQLKNNLEQSRIDLRQEKLNFQDNVVDMVDDISDDYYDLFELAYERSLYRRQAANLQRAIEIARTRQEGAVDSVAFQRLTVERGNARGQVTQLRSEFRLHASRMKQELRLEDRDSLEVNPSIEVQPVDVSVEQAVQYGYSLRPRLRRLELGHRESELDLKNARGWNSFRVELEATYGREMRNAQFDDLWRQPQNSYSVGMNVTIPIWDWGRHESQLEARRIGVKRSELRIEEARRDIRNDVSNAVQSLNEYQDRALKMQKNLEMASNVSQTSLDRFRAGEISALELIQTLNSQVDTARNLLDAYLGYRQALVDLLRYTYYDFENEAPVFRRFDMGEYGPSPATVKDALESAESVSSDASGAGR